MLVAMVAQIRAVEKFPAGVAPHGHGVVGGLCGEGLGDLQRGRYGDPA